MKYKWQLDHLKYEPDQSTHGRDKEGVKITVDLRKPCSSKIIDMVGQPQLRRKAANLMISSPRDLCA